MFKAFSRDRSQHISHKRRVYAEPHRFLQDNLPVEKGVLCFEQFVLTHQDEGCHEPGGNNGKTPYTTNEHCP